MNILLLGSGGREHTLAWKMKQSTLCKNLFIAPGNAGTSLVGENVPIGVNDFYAQKQFCEANQINMVVVGPEEPLVNGVYDFYKNDDALKNIIVVAPSAKAAQLEGSKSFSKHFMQRHKIPTASYKEFTKANFEEGKKYILQHSLPIVLKADGLAAGKGVVICNNTNEALQTFEDMILHQQFGAASDKVVIEQFLQGIEVSVFVLTNGKNYSIIGHAKDYKRIGEAETGLNTGGMGCVTPIPFMNNSFMQKVDEKIIKPTINGLQEENLVYNGFIFFGLMNVQGEPYVIEYNCRMGDPETEVVMPRLKNDLVELFVAMEKNNLQNTSIEYNEDFFATIMAVSGGYPGEYKKNLPIYFNNELQQVDSIIFHAGTKKENDLIVTNGGRVLAVTSQGSSITEAVKKSTTALQKISFEGMYYRRDIGFEFV